MTMDEDTSWTPPIRRSRGPRTEPTTPADFSSAPGPVVPVPLAPTNQPPKRREPPARHRAGVGGDPGDRRRRVRRRAGDRPGPAQAARGFNGNGGFFRNGGSFDPGAGGGNGQGPRFAFGGGGALAIDGTVTAVTANSITIKRADGQEVTFDVPARLRTTRRPPPPPRMSRSATASRSGSRPTADSAVAGKAARPEQRCRALRGCPPATSPSRTHRAPAG